MIESTTRILGIDPGTRHVGYAVLEQRGTFLACLVSGCISAGEGEMATRLVAIHQGLQEVIDRHRPDAAAIETVFTSHNPKTAIAIGEGRGVAVLSAAERGLTVNGYEPALVKKAVAGNGRAGKEQVRSMVKVLLNLGFAPETDHESDAMAIAITHALHCRMRGAGAGAQPHKRCARKKLPEFVLQQLPPGMLTRVRRQGK